jgi:hypothetical protein
MNSFDLFDKINRIINDIRKKNITDKIIKCLQV